MSFRDDPLVIGALGGSGTRVFAKIARHAGFFMGADLNRHEDSDPLIDFYSAWIPPYLHHHACLDSSVNACMREEFNRRLDQHLSGDFQSDQRWGIKNPKSIHMLDFWHKTFPKMRFIHVVRNGLDMAYSGNQLQFHCYREFLFDRKVESLFGLCGKIKFWSRVNELAADFGEQNMKERYLRVRFEDLCDAPEVTVQRIFDFLDVSDVTKLALAIDEVAYPKSIARWRKGTLQDTYHLMIAGQSALEHFGYWNDADWNQTNKQFHSTRLQRWVTRKLKMKLLST